jgi:tetratricopeptide (TPR) repeat protein
LRAGRSGDAIIAEVAEVEGPWLAAGLAGEILPDPVAPIELCLRAGRMGHAVFLAARAGDAETLARVIDLGRERDPARKLALAVLLGEALLTLGDRDRATEQLLPAQLIAADSRRLEAILSVVGAVGDSQKEAASLLETARSARPGDATELRMRAAWLLHLDGAPLGELEALLPRDDDAAMWLLERQLGAAQRWDDLAQLEVARLKAAPHPVERASLARIFAWRWLQRVSNKPEQVSSKVEHVLLKLEPVLLQAVTPAQSDLPAVLTLARRAAESTGDWGILERVAAAAAPLDEEDRALAEAAKAEAHAACPVVPTQEGSIDAVKKLIAAEPKARPPRRELAQLLRRGEKWRVLVEALREEEATACATAAERAAVLREIVVVCRDHLKHELLVTSSLSEILMLSPDDESALDQLGALHAQHKRWAELVTILGRRAARLDVPKEAAALHLRIARILLEHLGNEGEAVKQLERVLELMEHVSAEVIQVLDGLYTKRREWEKLVALGRRRLLQEPDAAKKKAQALELARLSEKAKKSALSIECWEQVLALDPDEPEALSALEKLYERERRWPELAVVCARQAESTSEPARQAVAWQKLGQLYTERVDDSERAIDAWRRLLAIQPDSVRAHDALKKLFVARRAWNDLEALFGTRVEEYLRTLERQVELENGGVQLELLGRAAILYRDRLRRSDRALKAFERMLELDAKSLLAAEGLIPLYGGNEPAKLARVLAVQLEHTGDPSLRQERLRRLGQLHEQSLRDSAGAFKWWLAAVNEDPIGSRVELERLAAATGEWRALVSVYRNATSRLVGPAALPLLRVIARAEEQELGDVESAVATWRRILELDFRNEEALDALERLYTGREQHAELVVVCQRRLELAADPVARRKAFLKIAQLAELRLSDDALAIRTYAALLDEDPRERSALEALDRLYRKTSQWRVLAQVLERQLQLSPEDDAIRLQLAALREQQLGDVAGAIALFQKVLERDPSSKAAREALERHLRGELQHEAATILLPIYERAGEWARLCEAYEVLAGRAQGERLVEMLRTLGRIREEKLDDAAGALDAYTRALRAAPADRELYVRLEKLAERLEAWTQLVTLYREIASRPLALPVQIELRCRLGRLYRDRLNEIERAVATFQRVSDLDAKNPEATSALEDLYGRTGRKVELAELLRRRLSSVESLEERVQVATRLVAALGGDDETVRALESELAIKPDDPARLRGLAELLTARVSADPTTSQARALELWEKLAKLQPDEPRAFDALAELHLAAGRFLEAAKALERRTSSPSKWARLYRLRLERLDDPVGAKRALTNAIDEGALDTPSLGLGEKAQLARAWAQEDPEQIERWQRVLELDPKHEEARTRLEALYRRAEMWKELIALLKERLPLVEDKPGRIAVWLDIDRIFEEQLGDSAGAYAALCNAYREDPDDEMIESELLRRANNPDRWHDAARELQRVAERMEAENPRAAVDRWVKISRIYDEQLDSLDEAALILKVGLASDPDHKQALELLASLHQKRGAWGEMVPLLYHRAEVEADPATRAALFLSVGDMLEVQEGDSTGAIKAYQQVLQSEPANAQARYSLENLYRRSEMWPELLDLLATRAQTATDQQQKLVCLLEMGQILDERLNDAEQAAVSYRQALEADPMSIDAFEGLERLYRAAGDIEGEMAILDHELALWPDHADYVYEKMEGALREACSWEQLTEIYREHLLAVENPARRIAIRCALAEVYELELKDPARAKEAFQDVLHEQPDEARALDGLARLATTG